MTGADIDGRLENVVRRYAAVRELFENPRLLADHGDSPELISAIEEMYAELLRIRRDVEEYERSLPAMSKSAAAGYRPPDTRVAPDEPSCSAGSPSCRAEAGFLQEVFENTRNTACLLFSSVCSWVLDTSDMQLQGGHAWIGQLLSAALMIYGSVVGVVQYLQLRKLAKLPDGRRFEERASLRDRQRQFDTLFIVMPFVVMPMFYRPFVLVILWHLFFTGFLRRLSMRSGKHR